MTVNYSQLLHHVAFLHHGAFSPEIKKINFKLSDVNHRIFIKSHSSGPWKKQIYMHFKT